MERSNLLIDMVNLKDPTIVFRGYVGVKINVANHVAKQEPFILTLIGSGNKMVVSGEMLKHYTAIKLSESATRDAEKAVGEAHKGG